MELTLNSLGLNWEGLHVRGLFTNTTAPHAPQPAQCADGNGACRGPTAELGHLQTLLPTAGPGTDPPADTEGWHYTQEEFTFYMRLLENKLTHTAYTSLLPGTAVSEHGSAV